MSCRAPVIEEDQLTAHETWPSFAITRTRRSNRKRAMVPIAAILMIFAVFRYRRHRNWWSRAKYLFSLFCATKVPANEWHFDEI